MALLELSDIGLAFGGPLLLDGVNLRLEPGERVCLIGRNGAGKSTLLQVAAGIRPPDTGKRIVPRGIRVALLPQDVPRDLAGTVREAVIVGAGGDDEDDRWQIDLDVDRVLTEVGLDPDSESDALSAGQTRRLLLARALARRPDLLLLDEPTNHLDIPSIVWLEDVLSRWSGTLLFVTHDRDFVRRHARRIVELDRSKLVDWTCDFDTWLGRKEALLSEEEARHREFDKRLAVEETWIRRGTKARRTRNEGRVRRLETMRRERADRRRREGDVRMQVNEAARSGKLVAEGRGLTLSRGGRCLFRDLDLTIMRGDRVGVIGPNGAGKTSLLQILLGELAPDDGELRVGTNLQPAYFDQLRHTLDPDRSVRWNVAEGQDKVEVDGRPRHVVSYLADFLFSPERAAQPVQSLSGGERNRLLLARLFTQPANVLVLDEPTNDLDLETLELLENLLAEFSGTVLLVSHDRAFLDDVVTSTLVFDGQGGVKEFVGGYSDWMRQTGGWARGRTRSSPSDERPSKGRRDPMERKLKWKEQRELESLPAVIEGLEAEQARIHAALADPELYKGDGSQVTEHRDRLAAVEVELATVYARWEELEDIAGSG